MASRRRCTIHLSSDIHQDGEGRPAIGIHRFTRPFLSNLRCGECLVLAVLFCATLSAAQQPSLSGAPAAISSYPDSPKGLEKLIKDMLKLQKDGDTKDLAPYVHALVLPNPDSWFRATFGDRIGATLTDSYDRTRMDIPLSFPDTLSQLLAKHLTSPQAVSFTDSCNPKASPTEYPVLILRQDSQPLYDVRFVNGRTMMMISYFAYVDGLFRYLGHFQVRGSWPIIKSQPSAPSKAPERILVGGDVQAARLIHQVMPVYPIEAKLEGLQGTVILHAIIDKDGAVRDLQLLEGHCWLAQPAIKAVSQWQYKPTLLLGKPVEVDTMISVIYRLQQ